jgi:hypothetical protein
LGKQNLCEAEGWREIYRRPCSSDARRECVNLEYLSVIYTPPQELFSEKDYLNGRFFHKRAYYLSVIAAHIKKLLPVDVFYDSTNNDPRLSSILIQSKEG